jgi:hypothetical protein
MTDGKRPAPRRRLWPWILAALILVLFAVPVAFPEIVRPLGLDPGVFEDIQWIFRRAFGQKDHRPVDL